jgi:hypothetical protein
LASGHNNIDIVTLLLTKGADANIKVRKSLIRKKNF